MLLIKRSRQGCHVAVMFPSHKPYMPSLRFDPRCFGNMSLAPERCSSAAYWPASGRITFSELAFAKEVLLARGSSRALSRIAYFPFFARYRCLGCFGIWGYSLSSKSLATIVGIMLFFRYCCFFPTLLAMLSNDSKSLHVFKMAAYKSLVESLVLFFSARLLATLLATLLVDPFSWNFVFIR